MRTVRVAFYKESDNFKDKFRKMFGKYSRVEIIVNSKIYSITPKDGVTIVTKTYDKTKWDFIDIDINNTFIINKVQRFLNNQVGKKFDYFGATFGQLLGLGWQDSDKWYDVELISKFFQCCLVDEFMELNPSKMNINKLYNILSKTKSGQSG